MKYTHNVTVHIYNGVDIVQSFELMPFSVTVINPLFPFTHSIPYWQYYMILDHIAALDNMVFITE